MGTLKAPQFTVRLVEIDHTHTRGGLRRLERGAAPTTIPFIRIRSMVIPNLMESAMLGAAGEVF